MTRHLTAAAIATSLFVSPILAADDPPTPTITTLGEILNGLVVLSDGHYAVDKDGKVVSGADGKAVKVPFKLGKYRMTIASNITLLRGVLKDVEDARQALIRENIPDIPDVGDPQNSSKEYRDYLRSDKYKQFEEAYKAMANSPPGTKITLARIKLDDLKVGDDPGQNPIPPVALSQLDPILDK